MSSSVVKYVSEIKLAILYSVFTSLHPVLNFVCFLVYEVREWKLLSPLLSA